MDDDGWGFAGLAVAAAAFALAALVIGGLSLAIPFGAPDSMEEGYDLHDCGSPGAYVMGDEEQWRDWAVSPTTLPGDPSPSDAINAIPRQEACEQAVGSRLRFTVWAFGLGLLASVAVGVAAPAGVWERRRRRRRADEPIPPRHEHV